MKKLSITFCLFLLAVISANSQPFFRLGASLGTMTYTGDLNDSFLGFNSPRPGFGAMVGYQFHPNMAVRANYNQGWLFSTDQNTKNAIRNLEFRTAISEFSAQFIYEPLGYSGSYRNQTNWYRYDYRSFLTPYVGTGLGIMHFNPQGRWKGTWIDLQPLGTEGQYLVSINSGPYPEPYSLTQIFIPLTIGARWRATDNIDVSVELSARKLFTDYLDDVSMFYPDPWELNGQMGKQAFEMSYRHVTDINQLGTNYQRTKRGGATGEDWYYYTNVTVSYIFARNKVPIRFKR
ncbi:MAG: DUF6089 family protein [Bacteroidia bacterium]|nr:DUF6089 family protein [Bacteroidia bacterium]